MALKPTYEELERRVRELEGMQAGRKKMARIFEEFAQASIEGLAVADLDGKLSYVNPALGRILGGDHQDFVGTNIRSYYLKKDLSRLEKNVLPAVEIDVPQKVEMPLVSIHGKRTNVIQSIFLIYDEEGKPHYANVITDITERKRAEGRLKRQRNRLEEEVSKRTGDLRKTNETLQQEIAAHREVADALEREKERAQHYFDVAPVITLVIGTDQKVQLINNKGCEVLGWSKEEIVGQDWIGTCIPKRNREEVGSVLEKVLAGEVDPVEYHDNPVLTRSGEERIISWHNAVLVDESGGIVGTLTSGIDITEKVQAERELQKSETEKEAILDATVDCLMYVDRAMNIIWTNKAMADVYDKDPEELIGRTCYEALAGSDARCRRCACAKAMETGKVETSVLFQPELGAVGDSYWENYGVPIKDDSGEIIGGIEIGRNVTERVKAEEQLRESEKRYRGLFESSRDAIVMTSRDGHYIDVNQAALDLFGYTRDEMLAINAKETYVNPDDRESSLRAIEEKGYIKDYDLKLKKRDGTVMDVVATTHLRYDDDGNVVGVQGIMRDVTEKRRVQKALQESEARHRIISEITSDLALEYRVEPDGTRVPAWITSEAYEAISGYNPVEIEGVLTFDRIVHPDDADIYWKRQRNLLAGHDDTSDYRIITKAGEVKWVRAYGRPEWSKAEDRVVRVFAAVKDITAQKMAEEALERSENRLRLALDGTNTGLYEWYPQTGQTYFSPTWFAMLGYEPDEFPHSVDTFKALIHPDERHRVEDAMNDVLKGRTVHFAVKCRMRSKNGRYRWIRDQAKVFERDNEGNPVRMVGTHVDITERVEAEEVLRESEQRFRTLVEQAPFGIEVFNADGLQTQVNKAWQTMWNVDSEDTVGKYNVLKDAQLRKQEVFPLIERLFSGEAISFPDMEVDPSKTGWASKKRWIRTRGYPARDQSGRIINVVLFHEDITERKESAEEVRASERKYRNLYEGSPDGYAMIDMEGRVIECNSAFREMLGYTEEELLQKPSKEITPEKWWAQTAKAHEEQLFTSGHSHVYEKEYLKKDGTVVPVEIVNHLVKDEDGSPKGIWGWVRDITPRKEKEAAIQKLTDELEQRVIERTQQLRAANKELEAFAYSVSHDLRAPLRSIQGFSQIIAHRHRDTLNEEGQHYFANIVEASEQMNQLISDILNYSRVGRDAVNIEPISLKDIFAQVAKSLSGRIAEKKARIDIEEKMPVVAGDWTILGQVFSNLVSNALTYHQPGSPPEVTVRCETAASHVTVSVRDKGIGIGPEFHDKIFNIFQRLHRQDEYPGTGVGLAIVKKSAKLLDGEVWLESEAGKGSTFYLKLPLAE